MAGSLGSMFTGIGSGAASGAAGGPIGTLIGAGIGLFGSLFGAHEASSASQYAADLQYKALQQAIQLQREGAEADWRNWETTRKANYGLAAAREGRLSTLGHLIGMPDRDMPAYVPSVDPTFTAPPTTGLQNARLGRARDLV